MQTQQPPQAGQQRHVVVIASHQTTGREVRLGPYRSEYSIAAISNALVKLGIDFRTEVVEPGNGR